MSVPSDFYANYTMRIWSVGYTIDNLNEDEWLIGSQFYSDRMMISLCKDDSLVITRYEDETTKIFKSAAKYWHRTRKIWLNMENKTHWLVQFSEYYADKHSEKIVKYYLDRKKK